MGMGEGAGMGEGMAIPLLAPLLVPLLVDGESVGGRYKGGMPGEGTG
jgi:hypothetical protein